MGFLDNSGDIILDAVLTDTGRFRMAKGDGSFRITKYAFGDDEINYTLYNKDHTSGSAYYDLDIMQTPVFEAFTNNTSLMKSMLMSIPRTDLFYLPVILLNEKDSKNQRNGTGNEAMGNFVVLVDASTEDDTAFNGRHDDSTDIGVILGTKAAAKGTAGSAGAVIRLDQGLHTTEISNKIPLQSDLVENQYIVEIDNRLGTIVSKDGSPASFSYLDDDGIATYFLTLSSDGQFVSTLSPAQSDNDAITAAVDGPRGSTLEFRIATSLHLQTSSFFFTKFGKTDQTDWSGISGKNYHYLDSSIKVTGATTGYSVSIPVRFVKKA